MRRSNKSTAAAPPMVPRVASMQVERRRGPPPLYELPPEVGDAPEQLTQGVAALAVEYATRTAAASVTQQSFSSEGFAEDNAPSLDAGSQAHAFAPPHNANADASEADAEVDLEEAVNWSHRTVRISAHRPRATILSSPWAWLAPELLAQILNYLKDHVPTLVRCSLVCRHWHAVLQETAALWRSPRLVTVPDRGLLPVTARYGVHFRVINLQNRHLPMETWRLLFSCTLTHVREIDLRFSTKISSPVLKAISRSCRVTEALVLSLSIMPAGLRPDGLAQLHRCHKLRYLNFSECSLSMDLRLSQFAIHQRSQRASAANRQPVLLARNSRRIGGFATQLTDEALLTITDGCQELEELYLSGCRSLTPQVAEVLGMLPNLRVLDLSFCDQIASLGFRKLADTCKRLQVLYVVSCRLSSPDLVEMQRLRPGLALYAGERF